MAHVKAIRARHKQLMKTSIKLLERAVMPLPEEAWRTWRDGEDGWTILEIVCHLRDFEKVFHHRAQLMLDHDHPDLGAYDHEAMAIERKYNEQPIEASWTEFAAAREQFLAFFENLSEAQWEATGDHPERRSFDMVDAVMQVGLHDINHLEQITRVIQNYTRK